MSLRVIRPCRLLEPYVSAIWDYQDLFGGENSALSILPDTATYLCFLYADLLTTEHKDRTYTTRSGLAEFQCFRSDLGGTGKICGVSARLTPWGLNVFCRGVVPDCAERRVDCRDIFPQYAIEELEDSLARAGTAAERMHGVEHFLLTRLNRHHEDLVIQQACKALDRSGGNCSIASLARHLGLTEHTLQRRFQGHIGVTPKRYARIVRLRSAVLQRKELPSWADVAHAAGYSDQSHMIHEFQAFYGMPPDLLYPQAEASRTIRFSGLLNLSRGG